MQTSTFIPIGAPLVTASILLGALVLNRNLTATGEEAANSKTNVIAMKTERLLRHVVLLAFKQSSSEADVQTVIDAFGELPKKIETIAAFEYGQNNSPEGHADGFTHCFFVSFKSDADRAAYLPHPAHLAFVEVLKPHLEKVLVIDYWAQE